MTIKKGQQAEFDDEDESENGYAAEAGLADEDDLAEDGYRVLRLDNLVAEDDVLIVEAGALPPPTLSLEEVLQQLIVGEVELPLNELAVLADLTRAQVEFVRRQWPLMPVPVRRLVVEALVTAAEERFELYLPAFLRLALDDSDAVVRCRAVEGLQGETGEDLLGRLVQLVETDPEETVRAAAAAALGPFVLAGELDELNPALAMRAEDALLATFGASTTPLSIKQRALESLAYSGEAGVAQLIEDAYYSPQPAMRLSALRAMGRSADVRWRRWARAELRNPDPAMRAEAAYACGELDAARAVPDLVALLADRNQQVRLNAIYALGQIGGRQAKRALRAVAESSDALESMAAEDALAELAFMSEVMHEAARFEAEESSRTHAAAGDDWDADDELATGDSDDDLELDGDDDFSGAVDDDVDDDDDDDDDEDLADDFDDDFDDDEDDPDELGEYAP